MLEAIKTAMGWMTANWAIVSASATLLVMVSNSLTKHWSGHVGFVRVVTWITERLSVFTSKDVPGWFKLPLTSISPALGEAKMRLKLTGKNSGLRCLLPLALLVGSSLFASTLSGCATSMQPRKCKHLDGVTLGSTSWVLADCLKAQTKRDWLVGITAGLAAAGGAGGIAAIIPDSTKWRLGAGITSAVFAIGAAVLAPFTASAVKNLSDHCTDLSAGVSPRPASQPWLPSLP